MSTQSQVESKSRKIKGKARKTTGKAWYAVRSIVKIQGGGP